MVHSLQNTREATREMGQRIVNNVKRRKQELETLKKELDHSNERGQMIKVLNRFNKPLSRFNTFAA